MNKNQIYRRHKDCSFFLRILNMKGLHISILILTLWTAGCSSGNPHVEKVDKKGGQADGTAANQSQPAVLQVKVNLKYPKTAEVSAEMYFYNPTSIQKP